MAAAIKMAKPVSKLAMINQRVGMRVLDNDGAVGMIIAPMLVLPKGQIALQACLPVRL